MRECARDADIPRREKAGEKYAGIRNAVGPKEEPGDADKDIGVKSSEPHNADRSFGKTDLTKKHISLLPGERADYLIHTVKRSPEDERPSRAVPKTRHNENYHNIKERSCLSAAAAAEGKIEVVLKPGGKGYMPS